MPEPGVAILDSIISLPPQVNKFLAAAEAIEALVLPAPLPVWARRASIAFAGLYACQIIVAVLAIAASGKASDSTFWLVRSGRGGLWSANVQVVYSLLSGLFCACDLAALAWQLMAEAGIAGRRGLIFVHGIRWIPLYWSGWIFAHSLAVQGVNHVPATSKDWDSTSVVSRHGSTRTQQRKISSAVLCLNFAFVAVPLMPLLSITTIFTFAGVVSDHIYDVTGAAVEALRKAAPGYDPSTFTISQLLPFLVPLAPLRESAIRFDRFVNLGWTIYASLILILTMFTTPLLVSHLRRLHRLSGASSFPKTLFGTHRRTRSATSTTSALTSLTPADAPAQQAQPYALSNGGWASSTDTLGSVKRPLVMKTAATAGEKNAQTARELMWTALLVYLAGVVYLPLAIWATQTNLQDPDFQIGQTMIGSGSYAIFGLIIHCTFLLRVLRQIRASKSTLATSSAARAVSPAVISISRPPTSLSRARPPTALSRTRSAGATSSPPPGRHLARSKSADFVPRMPASYLGGDEVFEKALKQAPPEVLKIKRPELIARRGAIIGRPIRPPRPTEVSLVFSDLDEPSSPSAESLVDPPATPMTATTTTGTVKSSNRVRFQSGTRFQSRFDTI